MNQGYFITGTVTDCGKTEITLGLMQLLQSRGQSVNAMKPVASGAQMTTDGLCNGDALRLQGQGSVAADYRLINPYTFSLPVAPHIAARQADQEIGLELVRQCYQSLVRLVDWVLVEGVGGWYVPLGRQLMVSDLARSLGLPVILVVGMKLGCLNHALLTVESIRASGCELAGWVANRVDPGMLEEARNIESLRYRIQAPMLGQVPHLPLPSPSVIAEYLDLSPLNLQLE